MRNKVNNEYLRTLKEEAVKEAIKYLHDHSVTKITNRAIVDTIAHLYPIGKETKIPSENTHRQINVNTLSKTEFYKENIPKWINEIIGAKQNGKALEAASKAKEKNYREKLKLIEKYANDLISDIMKGEIECEKFTKTFLVVWLNENKKMNLAKSIFSSTEEYRVLYEKLEKKFYRVDIKQSNEDGISVKDYGKIKRDLIVANEKLEHLVSNLFVSANNSDKSLVEEKGNAFKGIFVDKDTLYKYLDFMKKKLDNEINAEFFFRAIVEECRVKK
jgi:hypothetical protein